MAFLIFAGVIAIIFSFFLSGVLVLVLNKVGFANFFKIYYPSILLEALSNSYPYTYTSIGISLIFCFGVSVTLFFLAKQKESLFGEARFATDSEIRKTGLFGDKNNYVKRGILIGKYKDKFLKFGGQQFVALGAPTRSGKGVGIVIPNLLHWEESAVVQDIKQECFDYTSKYRAEKLDNKVFLFNPFSTRTHRYNPFTYINMADEENADSQLMDLANIIYPLGTDDTSKFFSQQAQNLFIGLCYLYKDLTMTNKGRLFVSSYNLEVEFNFFGILQLSKGFEVIDPDDKTKLAVGFEETYKLLDNLEILGKATKRRIGTYIQIDSPNTKSGVMSSFNAPLSAFEGEPETYNPAYEKWNLNALPLNLPYPFRRIPIPNAQSQLKTIIGLINKNEVTEIIHCGDADEEGQILIDEILEYAKTNKPILRCLINDITPKAIQKAMSSMQSNSNFKGLSESGFARSEADFIVGLNATRLYTLLNQRNGGQGVVSVGRVQTPILALIVNRELENKNHKSLEYFSINGDFCIQDSMIKAPLKLEKEERITEESQALNIKKLCEEQEASLTITKEEKKNIHHFLLTFWSYKQNALGFLVIHPIRF